MLRSRLFSYRVAVLFCLGFLINYGDAQEGSSCQTPKNIGGQCIDLRKCDPMVQLIGSLKRPYTTRVTQQLNAYRCGSQGNIVLICCPPGPIALDPEIEDRVDPPDVTTHRNINLLPERCGHLESPDKIVGGKDAGITEFPWMALLVYRTEFRPMAFLCGGSIIRKNYILTAAHCVSGLTPTTQLIKVRVGEHTISNETDCQLQVDRTTKCNPPVQDLNVEEIIPHPKYGGVTGQFINDIALIRVSTINLELENARPVCLPIGIARDSRFKNAWVTGWGVQNITTGKKSDVLQKASIPLADKENCAKLYRESESRYTLHNTQICVGGGSIDSCGGDSGGPMVVATFLDIDRIVLVQQGIVSFGPTMCGATSVPGVYTQVKYYMDWILDNIRE